MKGKKVSTTVGKKFIDLIKKSQKPDKLILAQSTDWLKYKTMLIRIKIYDKLFKIIIIIALYIIQVGN